MEEKIIAIAPRFNSDKVTRTMGDLIFTNERMLFIKRLRFADILSIEASFNLLLSPFIQKYVQKKTGVDNTESMSIEEIRKSKFSKKIIKYNEVSTIEIIIPIFGAVKIIINYKNGKRQIYWGKKKNIKNVQNKFDTIEKTGISISINK